MLRLPQIEFSRRNHHGNRPFLIGLKSRNLLNYVILNQYSGFSAAKQTCQVEIRFYSCWRTSIFFPIFTWWGTDFYERITTNFIDKFANKNQKGGSITLASKWKIRLYWLKITCISALKWGEEISMTRDFLKKQKHRWPNSLLF